MNLRVIDPAEAPGERFDAELAALVKAREEGLIDGVGLSNVSRQQLLRAVDQTEIVCVQNLFNLGDQGSADVLAECARRGIAFVPFCPLGLPGPARSHLLTSPVLAALGARLDATPAQIALAWLLGARTEHPAHPGNPDARPPGREPGSARGAARRRRPRPADQALPRTRAQPRARPARIAVTGSP